MEHPVPASHSVGAVRSKIHYSLLQVASLSSGRVEDWELTPSEEPCWPRVLTIVNCHATIQSLVQLSVLGEKLSILLKNKILIALVNFFVSYINSENFFFVGTSCIKLNNV